MASFNENYNDSFIFGKFCDKCLLVDANCRGSSSNNDRSNGCTVNGECQYCNQSRVYDVAGAITHSTACQIQKPSLRQLMLCDMAEWRNMWFSRIFACIKCIKVRYRWQCNVLIARCMALACKVELPRDIWRILISTSMPRIYATYKDDTYSTITLL